MIETLSSVMAWMRVNWLLLLFFATIAGAFIFLRSTPSDIEDSDELSGLLHDGHPTILEFYSNY